MIASISKLSELSGLDRRTIASKLADLPFKEGPKNAKLYDVSLAMRTLYGAASTGPDGPLDPQQEKALLDRARRLVVETEHKKRLGELLEATTVAETWSQQVQIAKGRLLALPARLAPAVLGLGDLRAIEGIIREAIFEALTELSADPQP